MPPQQGEVSLLTLFGDVHYYISPPSQKPPHHRFDKGSYVYLYHNPIRQNGRIEIANHAGTPEQDAFAGQMDTVKVEHTYKHPCLFTLTVDGFRSQSGSPATSPQQDASQWHLPVYDPTNQDKYMYRLHTLDIYFWTPEDANLFADSLRRVMQPHQLQFVANPQATPTHHAEHKSDALSPVIARLENAAISQSSRSSSISTPQPFPGPPAAPPPTSSPPAAQAGYAPMAYNPAAPAAPEPIAHREKTPPPPDVDDGTGLASAAAHDHHASQYSNTNPFQASFAPQPTSGPYKPGPPAAGQGFSGPPQPGMQRTNTSGSFPGPPKSPPSFAPPPSAPPPGQYDGQTPPPGIQRSSTMPTQQFANYPGSPGFPPAPQSPPAHGALPSPGFAPQKYQPMASPPPGGYSQFQYGSTSAQVPGAPGAIHQQLYRPSEQEASVVDHTNPNPAPRNSNIGKRVDKVEKGVGKFLKKLDKKF